MPILLNGAENMKMALRNNTKKRIEKEIAIALKLNNFRLFKISKTLLLLEDNQTYDEVAKLFHVSVRTIYNWVSRFILRKDSHGFQDCIIKAVELNPSCLKNKRKHYTV